MKKLILSLLLAPFLLVSQPQFTITDLEGNTWDSNELLEDGVTIVIQFYSPSMTCWPSSNSIEHFTNAYSQYGTGCNRLFFLQIAEWGNETQVVNFLDVFGDTDIPTVVGDDGGYDITMDFYDNWGLMWAYELWLMRPDGSYEYDIPWAWDLEQTVLLDLLEDEGFAICHGSEDENEDEENNTVGLEDYKIESNDKTIYDLQGRILNKIPTKGFYIQGGKKYIVIK